MQSKDERTYIIDLSDKVNSILVAALRELDEEQMICLRDALIERTPQLRPSKDVEEVANEYVIDTLEQCREYMNDKADVKSDNDYFVPNMEAILLDRIDATLSKIAGEKWAEQAKEDKWEKAWNKLYEDFKQLDEYNINLREENKRYKNEIEKSEQAKEVPVERKLSATTSTGANDVINTE